MAETKKSAKAALSALKAEMAKPHITASALAAMQRKLALAHDDSFHGYACNWCGCRFSSADIPNDVSLSEILRLSGEQLEKHFADHVCSERPHTAR